MRREAAERGEASANSPCFLFPRQDVINQLMEMEAVVARARSLKAKFGLGKGERGEDTEELER